MLRSILSVVVAAVTWIAVATLLNLVIRFTWSDYAAVEQSMHFTLPMLLLRLLIGVIASFVSGFVGARVAKGGKWPMGVFATLLLAMFLPVHYNLWSRFPVWYHGFFLMSLVVFTTLGAWIHLKWQARIG
jgi:hypothetical protein